MLQRLPPPPSLLKRLTAALGQAIGMPRARPFTEMGVSGTAVWGGYVTTREKSSKWTGHQRWITTADMAVNTSIIAAGVHYFLNLIAHPHWTFAPAEEDNAEAQELAEFAEEVLTDALTTPWSRIVRRAGTYRFYGFGLQEWTAVRREDGRIGFRDIEPRPQHTIEQWSVTEDGTIEGVVQRSPQTGQYLSIPRSKLIYLVDDTLTDSPEGVGIFRHLAEPWERLKTYYDLEARAFERDLRGIPIGRVPYGLLRQAVSEGVITKEQAQTLSSTVEDFVKLAIKESDTSITLDSAPYLSQAADGSKVASVPQWGMELLQGSANGVAELGEAIKRTQLEMARVLTVEHLMMGESSGNRALAEDKSRNLYLVANAVLAGIAAAFERDLLGPLWALNGFPDELKPALEVEEVAFKDAQTVALVLKDMATAGATLSPDDPVVNDVRELMGVSVPEPTSPEMAGLPTEVPPGPQTEEEAEEELEEEEEEAFQQRHSFDKGTADQPRVPAGSPAGGQFGSIGGGGRGGVSDVRKLPLRERLALAAYTGSAYRPVNSQLRDGSCCHGKIGGRDGNTVADQVGALDSAFGKAALGSSTTTYRGINDVLFNNISKLATPGKTILRDPAFVSTSKRKSVAEEFGVATIRIKVPKGARALSMSSISEFKSESEVLIGRGSKFRVTKINKRTRTIDVEMLL